MKSYTETGLLESNKMAQEKICLSTLKWKLGGDERGMQAGGLHLRIWVETEFHREREKTSQNNFRMGIAVAQTVRHEEDFWQQSFEKSGRKNTEK